MTEHIPFTEFINKISKIENKTEVEIDDQTKLYQVQGIENTNKCIVKHIGYGERPTILIKEFKFYRYNCKLYSYVLNDSDLINSLKIMSIHITEDNKLKYIISHEFENIENKINEEIEGNYKINLMIIKENETNTIIINENMKFVGKNKLIYFMVDLLSHDKIIKYLL